MKGEIISNDVGRELFLQDLRGELEKLQQSGSGEIPVCFSRSKGYVEIRGKRALDCANWDLFGLRGDPRLKRAVHESVEHEAMGTAVSQVVGGTPLPLSLAEERLASFLGQESTLLFSSRNQAVLTLITNLFSERDVVVVEEDLQSPVADAAYLVGAEVFSFSGRDLPALEAELKKPRLSGRKAIFIDSVNGLSGSQPPLPELFALAKRCQATVFIDETYALGFLGIRGSGRLEELFSAKDAFCVFGSLSYGVAGYGGFVAGPRVLRSWLIARSRTLREPPLPSSASAYVTSALQALEGLLPERRLLQEKVLELAHELVKLGYLVCSEPPLPYLVLQFSKHKDARELWSFLFSKGFLTEMAARYSLKEARGFLRVLIPARFPVDAHSSLLSAFQEAVKFREI